MFYKNHLSTGNNIINLQLDFYLIYNILAVLVKIIYCHFQKSQMYLVLLFNYHEFKYKSNRKYLNLFKVNN